MISRYHNKQQGITLIEALVYFAVIGFVVVVFSGALLFLLGQFSAARGERDVARGVAAVSESFMREMQSADHVDTGNSVFADSDGVLTLNRNAAGTDTYGLQLSAGRIILYEDGSPVDYLTPDNTTVNSLMFQHYTNTRSEGVIMTYVITSNHPDAVSHTIVNHAVSRSAYD